MIFFTDRDLGRMFPQILREAGLNVERHDDHFDQNTLDEDWLPEVGRKGWIAISRNKDIGRQPNERDAIMRAGTGLLIVVGPNATLPELAHNFVATMHKIEQFVRANPRPLIARVYRPAAEKIRRGSRKTGQVVLWLSAEEWKRKFGGK